MTETLVSASPQEQERVWNTWQDSPAHRVLRNHFVNAILAAKTELETVTPDNLPKLQGKLEALRIGLGILDRKGTPTTP